MSENIELEFLVGEHTLSGAFFDSVSEPEYRDSKTLVEKQVLRFALDGKNYEAVENPDDGYRNSLDCLRVTDTAPQNTFPPVKVIAKKKDKRVESYAGEDDILQISNAETGNVIIEIGTSDIDDYYPGFVALFSPHNL